MVLFYFSCIRFNFEPKILKENFMKLKHLFRYFFITFMCTISIYHKTFSQNCYISKIIDQWFVAVENGNIISLRSLIYPEYSKLPDDEMFDKINLLAGFYIKCLWVNEKKISLKMTSHTVEIIQNQGKDTKAKVKYSYLCSFDGNSSKLEQTNGTEYFYLKYVDRSWYLEKSELYK